MESAANPNPSFTAVGEPGAVSAPSAARRLARSLPGVVAAGMVAWLGVEDGGYFATAWGPLTLVCLLIAATVLIVHPNPNLGARALALPGLLALLVGWVLASSA
jgi:hypothetical protein